MADGVLAEGQQWEQDAHQECVTFMTAMDREILRLFRIHDNRREVFGALPAIFPRARAPVIRRTIDSEHEMVGMTWGFTRLQSGKAPKPVTNTRDDQARTNPF